MTLVFTGSGSQKIWVKEVTFCSVVCSSMLCTSFARSCSLPRFPLRKMARDGVFTAFATLISSFSLGTPSVTFLAPTPAKWKVFRVICVAGSPTLCAARVPIISPAWARDFMKRCLISPRSQSKDCFVMASPCRIFFEPSAVRRCAFRMILALSSTSRPMVSPSAMALVTSSSPMSRSTRSTTSTGVYLSCMLPMSSCLALCLARPMSLVMLIGMCCFESPSGKTSLQMTSFRCLSLSHSASRICCCSELARMSLRTSGGSQPTPYSSLS
mmetsp:Transcript_57261/g.167581  ORF Transcript_57261/g.167581 Transcript_57261/m.167581 type:complete len:270 (-) Transcript_57261:1574-2383(-)